MHGQSSTTGKHPDSLNRLTAQAIGHEFFSIPLFVNFLKYRNSRSRIIYFSCNPSQLSAESMRSYSLRRLLYLLPSVFLLLVLAFILIHLCPGNPVDRLVTIAGNDDENSSSAIFHQKEVDYWTHRLGLDLPLFYFSVHSLAEPDTLNNIQPERERKNLIELLRESGNTKAVMEYYQQWKSLVELNSGAITLQNNYNKSLNSNLSSLFQLDQLSDHQERLKKILRDTTLDDNTKKEIQLLDQSLANAISHPKFFRTFLPVISYHAKNQFHSFLFGDERGNKGIFRGDWGISYRTKEPVLSLIGSRIGWTLFFTLTSVILSFFISVPVALKSAAKPGSRFDRNSSLLFTILYSLPAFWLATLLMLLLCNPDVLNILPSSGIKPVTGYPAGSSLFEKIWLSLPYLILPTFCYTYSSFAFVTKSIRANALEVFRQDYIRTARAKGLDENKILWTHVFRNCLLPIITLFSNVFPFAISGSVILETVFTLPGMGLMIYQSVDALDYPVILAVFMISGLLTISGFYLSDLLYSRVDPRINLEK